MQKNIYNILLLFAISYIFSGCASHSETLPNILKSKSFNIKNKEWSNGFMIIPLKIQKDADAYAIAKERILKLLYPEVNRDRERREAIVREGHNRTAYCKFVTKFIRDRVTRNDAIRLCMQHQYVHDMVSLKTSFGKSLIIKKDAVAHYARYRWNLFTKCGVTQKRTTRDIYYGFIEPKESPKEAYMFLTYRTQHECEAVYERLRRKANRILRKAKRIFDKQHVSYTQIQDQF